MSDRAVTATSLTRRAIALIEDGEVADARTVLAEALTLDPAYEPAWLWFAHVAESPGERRFCLEQAAQVNPESNAKQELPKYRRVEPVEPPEVRDVVAPPLPPATPRVAPPAVSRLRVVRGRRGILAGAGIVALLAFVAAALLIGVNRPADPLYIAIAGGMSGPTAASGVEVVQSARLYFDRLNTEGGIDGHPVELLVFDDRNDPETARAVANEIVADGRALLVIGHIVSPAAVAAGPIYAEAGIPVITSTANADAVTADNPWAFRTLFSNRTQGFLIAAYIRHVLDIDRVSLLASDDDYGRSLADGIAEAFGEDGERLQRIDLDVAAPDADGALAEAVKRLQAGRDPGLIVLTMQADMATRTVTALKRAGIDAPLLGGDAIGSNRFLASFADLPEERETPGFFTAGIMAASPLFMDSLTSESLRWFEAYRDAYGQDPTWRGATTFDAAIAAATAMDAARVTGSVADRGEERQRIREALAGLDSPEAAVAGLLGPIFFDAERSTPRAAAFGVARDGRFSSAFEQLRPYATSANLSLDDDLASGVAIDVDGQLLERQRIVFTGVNVNEIGELDTTNPSFYADFFIWFTYTGDDSATDIVFANAVEPDLALGEPIRTVEEEGVTYALYRVAGRFKASLEFHDFPFDQQHLEINFENRTLPSSKLVYAVDRDLLQLTPEEQLRSGTNAAVSINAIPSWEATNIATYQGTVGSTALLGDPEANVGSSGIEYSLFTTDITITRDLAAFLVKNLLPLALLAAITYVSLFFPHSHTGARVSFGVSGILTAAVLLSTVTAVLPQVGYTVAIEWGFYAFILLSATCIIIGLAGDWLYEARRYSELRKLDRFSHIYYPVFVAVVVVAYIVRYAGA